MKIGYIVKPNSKGQIVIPQEVREELQIDENSNLNLIIRDKAVYLYPVKEVITHEESKNVNKKYLDFVKQSAGAWSDSEDWDKWDQRQEERRRKELNSIEELRKEW